ncbi:MAG: lysophospholipase L1-like esterase [Myxococcota bacterium]
MRPRVRDALLLPFLFPFAVVQGRRIRRDTPVLPEAAGERAGELGSGAPFHLLSLGDSTIAGVGLDDIRDTVTAQLAGRLAESHRVSWRAVGKTGATSASALTDLVPGLQGVNADVVVVSLGVNDALKGGTRRGFARRISLLIAGIRTHVGAVPVIVSGLPPLGDFELLPSAPRRFAGIRGQALDAGLADVANSVSDVTHLPLVLGPLNQAFAADGFHPSIDAHAYWADQLLPVVLQVSAGR